MRKYGILTQTIFFSIILAGIFGIIHDQITFSICPEYFTKFKYRQFNFTAEDFGSDRLTVAAIGFLATWWVGMFMGIVLGFTSLLLKDRNMMKSIVTKSLQIIFLITIFFSFLGFIYGRYYLTQKGVDWWIPSDINDLKGFITVGSIHNFSYIGGIIGLMAGIGLVLLKKYKLPVNKTP
ncbi:MAG: hypothetical protein JNJ86_03765 [Chitinophagaceae bacterium]|nr:hypothetical protein [Chitinophagaceae bacterium]